LIFRAGEEIIRAGKKRKYIFYLLRNSLLPLIKAWINEGPLKVGDDIMYVLVAGRLKTNVLPTFEELEVIVIEFRKGRNLSI
jgi:hypothetical protein